MLLRNKEDFSAFLHDMAGVSKYVNGEVTAEYEVRDNTVIHLEFRFFGSEGSYRIYVYDLKGKIHLTQIRPAGKLLDLDEILECMDRILEG